MNIKNFLFTAAAAAALAACSDYDPGLSEEAVNLTEAEEQLINEYTANFIDRYGQIDENHTWGFGEMGSVDEQGTRTQVQVNRNEWITLNKDNDRNLTSISYENMGGSKVPGFPSTVDGLYHIWKDYGASGDYTSQHEAIDYEELARRVKNGTDAVVPAGDVTDEEILYVSTWFRTHKNPTSESLDVDKFYVQAISKDYDRQSYQDVTEAEQNGTAPAWYNTTSGKYLTNLPLKYFLNGVETQYDYNGNKKDANATGSPVTYELDWLAVQKAANEAYEHINNFNSSNTAKISENNPTGSNSDYSSAVNAGINGTSYRMMEYVYDTGTHDFEVHSSNTDEMNNHWVLKHLTFTGRDGKNYDGWYLAFDIAYTKAEETVTTNPDDEWSVIKTGARDEDNNEITTKGTWQKVAYRDFDGYYSNYIVKIIPGNGGGTPIPNDKHWRIMCEDLGNTYDFDFNDLVYDVYYTGTAPNYTAHITLQAAGGTLPIYIGQKDDAHEVHRLFGFEPQANGSYLPVNVGTGKTADPKDITITGLTDTDPDYISIYVTTKTGGTTALNGNAITLLPPVGKSTSNAPQKICVHDTTVKWTKESQQIEWAYPHFDAWVQAQDGEYKIDGTTPWYKIDVDKDGKYLFSK